LVPGTRVAARIEYHGGDYYGWQAQPHLAVATVQETLENSAVIYCRRERYQHLCR
jgi:Pseudouridylate synthase